MIIKRLKLNNIRSYVSQEVFFPQSSVLLSGDIGSGKSTVLLAIDFALFGIRKPDLPGASLLRNGASQGSVEMDFEIDGKEVTIKRGLKRTSSSIVQDAGYIIIDGIKKEGTAVELKQAALDLLNYPKELLTKSKSLIYKYTVYTPQEEMKKILTENADLRLDTLRKVFGIDKYKRIKENAKILISAIKGKKRELAGVIHDLEQKKDELMEKQKLFKEESQKLEELKPRMKIIRQDMEKGKQDVEKTENLIKELNEIKKQIEIKTVERKNKENQKENLSIELKNLHTKIVLLEKEINFSLLKENVEDQIQVKKERLRSLEEEVQQLSQEIASLRTKKEQSEDLKNRIMNLNNCPTCNQDVTEDHKRNIEQEENNKIEAIKRKLDLIGQKYKETHSKLVNLKDQIEVLQKKKSKIDLMKLKKQNLDEKKKKIEEVQAQKEIFERELANIDQALSILIKEAEKYRNLEEKYTRRREELEKVKNQCSKLEKEEALMNNELKNIKEKIDCLKKEIDIREKSKRKLLDLSQKQEWLEKYFMNLMQVMEKNIMLKVHKDFDSLFQKWFNMIIDPEVMVCKLDSSFSPLIEQNGHDIDFGFLSGGEKTAVALSYRLSLNQIINKLMTTIKTNDILILDEPTDGFSNEQLDRVKDVIEDLDLSQIIIVSHEPKVETFVEKTIRFKKENHVSQII